MADTVEEELGKHVDGIYAYGTAKTGWNELSWFFGRQNDETRRLRLAKGLSYVKWTDKKATLLVSYLLNVNDIVAIKRKMKDRISENK